MEPVRCPEQPFERSRVGRGRRRRRGEVDRHLRERSLPLRRVPVDGLQQVEQRPVRRFRHVDRVRLVRQGLDRRVERRRRLLRRDELGELRPHQQRPLVLLRPCQGDPPHRRDGLVLVRRRQPVSSGRHGTLRRHDLDDLPHVEQRHPLGLHPFDRDRSERERLVPGHRCDQPLGRRGLDRLSEHPQLLRLQPPQGQVRGDQEQRRGLGRHRLRVRPIRRRRVRRDGDARSVGQRRAGRRGRERHGLDRNTGRAAGLRPAAAGSASRPARARCPATRSSRSRSSRAEAS